MPNLLAMSFEGELAPSFDMRCLHPGRNPPDGWGIGYYPGGEFSAAVLKEPAPPQGSIRSELIKAWEHLESSLFVMHIRTATWGQLSHANTQPFLRTFAGRDWMLAHSGSLKHRLDSRPGARFLPVGSTDTELVFCELMNMIAKEGFKSLGEIPPEFLRGYFQDFNTHGSLSLVVTDGHDLCAYADGNLDGGLQIGQLLPPYEEVVLSDNDVAIDLGRRGIKSRKGVIISSSELEEPGGAVSWRRVLPGHLVVIRQGAIRAEATMPEKARLLVTDKNASTVQLPAGDNAWTASPGLIPLVARPANTKRPAKATTRRFEVRHRTVYRYAKAVEQSSHLLRLVPMHDYLQNLLSSTITISVAGKQRDYEDVFGNRCRSVLLETPFTELAVEARSRVELLDTDPLSFNPLHARSSIPVVWMPWQGHMLQPFLLPPELPESELTELVQYAMSFVERNDYNLLDTLLDLNTSIFKEYEYRQGSTTVFTTPFDVYVNRRGVCQDFTNLFICLARLLGVPARYVCGYIYTGPKNPNQRQGEASHAWVQVYLPEVGWKGFDPTNGILTQTEHIRVATGRKYIDATPTSGTLYVGGGGESLEVDVRVEPCE